jgi:hypothetical protein
VRTDELDPTLPAHARLLNPSWSKLRAPERFTAWAPITRFVDGHMLRTATCPSGDSFDVLTRPIVPDQVVHLVRSGYPLLAALERGGLVFVGSLVGSLGESLGVTIGGVNDGGGLIVCLVRGGSVLGGVLDSGELGSEGGAGGSSGVWVVEGGSGGLLSMTTGSCVRVFSASLSPSGSSNSAFSLPSSAGSM